MPEISSWKWVFEPGGAPEGEDPAIYAEATIDGEQVLVPILRLEEPVYAIDEDGTRHRMKSTQYWGEVILKLLQDSRMDPI